ncbi:MAG TPA: ACT domain-containing protein, partial [Oscillospiraceae bacterium]|nr:ACT domain-containing protein [Oscillospiraceae bacterium]
MIKQVSVFVENKPGHLVEIASALAEAGIDIRALSLADTTNYGLLRLIVAEPDTAYRVLHDRGLTVSLTDVLAVGVDDRPGGMVKALSVLAEKQIS